MLRTHLPWRNLTFAVAAALMATVAHAGDAYDGGGFTLDLPDGYKLSKVTGEGAVHQFKAEKGPMLVAAYFAGATDLAAKQDEAVQNLAAGIPGLAPSGEVQRLKVNGHPAMAGIYQGVVEASGFKLPMECFVGVVQLEGKGIVQFFGVYSQGQPWKAPLQKSFDTLRAPGEPVTGEQPAPAK